MAVEVGGGVVDGEALLVALAHFGEDVDPGLGLHTVVGLDVQRSLRLDDLEHLRGQRMSSRGPPSKQELLPEPQGHFFESISPGLQWEGLELSRGSDKLRGVRSLHSKSKGVALLVSPTGPPGADCSRCTNGLVSLGPLSF